MEKFTKFQKTKPIENPIETKYNGSVISVLSYKGWEIASESDVVIVLPYMKDDDCILLRVEPVPTYNLAFPELNTDKFITVISGTMESGETPEQTIRRELYEKTGIVLSSTKVIEIDAPLAMTKGNKSKYYCCLIEISKGEYKQSVAIGDGSESEKNSQTISVKRKDIDKIKVYDVITKNMINEFKLKYQE